MWGHNFAGKHKKKLVFRIEVKKNPTNILFLSAAL